jgi:sugar lactone lactonase YvrE
MRRPIKLAFGALIAVCLCLGLLAAPLVAQQETWTYLGFQNQWVGPITVATGDSNLILVGGSNLNVSRDGGQTWTPNATLTQAGSMAFGSNPNVCFVVANYAVYKSTDGCHTWVQKGAGVLPGVGPVVVSPANDNTVYVGASGLWRSTDGGGTWTQLTNAMHVGRVDVSRSNPQVIYVGGGNGEWKSTDGGANWTKLPCPVPEYSPMFGIKVDPADENTVYGVWQISGGGWVSRDGGASWTNIMPYIEGFSVAVDVNRPGLVYAVGGWTCPKRSSDYGATGWKDMYSGYLNGFSTSIATDPNDSSKIYYCSHVGMYRWIADILPPNAPSNLTATVFPNAIQLNWTASGNSNGYLIYRRESSGSYPYTPYATLSWDNVTTYSDTGVDAGTSYCYKVCAVDNAQNRSGFTNEACATAPSCIDLDVTYIQRLPRDTHMYWVDYDDPGMENIPVLHEGTENDKRWPEFGEIVTFVAHFVNHGTVASGPANYRWKINGNIMATGTAPSVARGEEGTATLNWAWNVSGIDTDHTDQTVTFEIDYDSQIAESFEQNNSLTDYLEGVCLDFWIEPALYDALNRRENLVGTYSGEDWVQAQIKAMNDDFARSTYPLAPYGALERVRIDRLIVGYMPGPDYTADGRWMVSGGDGYAQGYAKGVDNGLIHELMHQLGIIDLYAIRLTAGFNEVITPDGWPNGTDWFFGRPGIMGGGDIAPHQPGQTQTMPEYIEYHSVMALNSNCGYKRGYYGDYLFDVPLNNYILVKDSAGNPAPNVGIKVFMLQGSYIPNDPVVTGTTDGTGKLLLTNRPIDGNGPGWSWTTATNHTEHPNPFGLIGVCGLNGIFLVEMSRPGGDFDYRYMDLLQFNNAYWSGYTNSWTYTINSRLASSTLPRVTTLNGAVEASKVVLSWPSVPSAVSYRLYKAAAYRNNPNDPLHQYENWVYRPIVATTATTYTDTDLTEPSRYAVVARDAAGREAPLSNRLFAPLLRNPWAVGIQADNNRVVLDPQNGYALMRQDGEGRYITNFGSVHYHLEYSHFMTIDKALGRLIISHPSDEYGGYQSIRVADLDANPIFEIGSIAGSAPGQFNGPTGVAVDPDSRIYAMDNGNRRIQIFDFGGNLITMYGSAGGGPGQFDNPQGIAVGSSGRIYVCDTGNARVQILAFDGTNVSYVGVLQGKAFNTPMAVAVGPGDKVFVTDYVRSTVEEFSSSGNWVRTYTTATGFYTGTLLNPTGIAVDNNGLLVVCDTGKRRVVSIAPALTVHEARMLPDGSAAQFMGYVVTAKFANYFYVEDADRTAGMRIASTAAIAVGDKVNVAGTLGPTPDPDRERQIGSATVQKISSGNTVPAPLGLNLRAMGGAAVGPVPGIVGASGLNNVGLLVRAFGTTSDRNVGASEFYLDDGSGFKVRVHAPGLSLPGDGSKVAVTGISGAEVSSGSNVRVLRAKSISTF